MRNLSSWVLMAVVVSSVSAQSIRITVTNPSGVQRTHEPVILPCEDLQPVLRESDRPRLRLVDEQHRSLPFQIDDLDADGRPDEFVFQTSIGPSATRIFVLTTLEDSLASPQGPLRTDAANYKRVSGRSVAIDDDDGPGTLRSQGFYPFDGVGWESEIIAYRLYLDERNAIDIQGKRYPSLQWNFIGTSGVDYQRDAYWGMDVLHVGSALGVGGFGFWINDSVAHPYSLEWRRTRILARGPVRAVVRIDYSGWDLGGEKVDVSSILTIFAGDRVTVNQLTMSRATSAKVVAVGIVNHRPAPRTWNQQENSLYTSGPQSRAGDGLFLAMSFVPSSVLKHVSDGPNHLVLLNLEKGKPLKYGISAYWEGETGHMWTEEETSQYLKEVSMRLSQPLQARIESGR